MADNITFLRVLLLLICAASFMYKLQFLKHLLVTYRSQTDQQISGYSFEAFVQECGVRLAHSSQCALR